MKNNYLNSILALISGNGLAQLIALLSLPLLTRVYSPEDFGLYALIVSVTTLLNSVICLRYETAIIIEKSHEGQKNLFILCSMSVVIGTLLVYVGAYIFYQQTDQAHLAILIAVLVFSQGLSLVSQSVLTLQGKFKLIAHTNLIRTCLTIALQLYLPNIIESTYNLLTALLVSTTLVSLIQWPYTIKTLPKTNSINSITSRLKQVIASGKKHKRFALFSSPGTLINTFSLQAPFIIFSATYGPAITGYYSMANTLIKAPANLLSNAYKQVHLKLGVDDPDNFGEQTQQLYHQLVYLGMPLLCLAFIDPNAISLVLGEQWLNVQSSIVLLGVFYWVWLPTSITTNVFSIKNEQKVLLLIQLAKLLLRITPLFIASLFISFEYALLTFVAFSCFAQFLQLFKANRIIQNTNTELLKNSTMQVLTFLPFAGLVLAINQAAQPIVSIVCSAFIITAYYMFVFHTTKKRHP